MSGASVLRGIPNDVDALPWARRRAFMAASVWRPGTFFASIVFDESLTVRQIIQSEYGRITRASSWSVTGELPIAFQISAVTLPPVKSA